MEGRGWHQEAPLAVRQPDSGARQQLILKSGLHTLEMLAQASRATPAVALKHERALGWLTADREEVDCLEVRQEGMGQGEDEYLDGGAVRRAVLRSGEGRPQQVLVHCRHLADVDPPVDHGIPEHQTLDVASFSSGHHRQRPPEAEPDEAHLGDTSSPS